MGCQSSKSLPEDVAAQKAPETWDEVKDRQNYVAPLLSEVTKERKGLDFKAATIERLLHAMGASREQLTFFDVWGKHVHDVMLDPAWPSNISEGLGCKHGKDELDFYQEAAPVGKQLFVSTDMRFLEIRLTGASPAVATLLTHFAEQIKDMPRTRVKEMRHVQKYLQEEDPDRKHGGNNELTIWCRFKHMRSDAPPPGVDCGYLINQDLHWAVIDVLMPNHEDQDALRSHCVAEKHHPQMYGSSILPIAPEKQLSFELKETATQNSRQILLTAFFFFKALGLMKPEDRIVRILNKCQCGKMIINVGIGPDGLVRMGLSMISPHPDPPRDPPGQPKKDDKLNERDHPISWVAKELSEELAFTFREKDVRKIIDELKGEADIIEYVGEMKGYSVRLGFNL